jgi:CheY-like chemotaxis protein
MGRILVVDNNCKTREYLKENLEKLGHDVVAVSDGPEASRIVWEGQYFDLAIIDQNLPSLSPENVVQDIKRKLPEISVIIMITQDIDLIFHIEAKTIGIDEIISKPPELNSLVSTIKKFFKGGEENESINY